MYIPSAFAETDAAKLFDFIEANSFGLLVSHLDGQFFATHLPLLLDRDGKPRGNVLGHMARANPQWRELSGQDVMVVFNGPHVYISPTWYESENVVPTWNYVAAHVYGKCELVDDQETAAIVERYVSFYERSMPRPWTIDTRQPFFEKLVRMVVGFRVEIARVEGKFKLNQNHPVERREKVVRHLSAQDNADAQAIARLMADTLR